MKKIVYIISNIDRWISLEWVAESFAQSDFKISFVLLTPEKSYFEHYLEKKEYPFTSIHYHGKKDIFKAIWKIYKYLKKVKPTVVHTHFLDANLAGLTAAFLFRVPYRIHTRHHSTFHHNFAIKGVLFDKYSNWLSTDIIAITNIVKDILLQENVKSSKITLIHHGFKLEEFIHISEEKICQLREKYQIPENTLVIGVVARHIQWKGVQYIVQAFVKLLNQYNNIILFLANARGDYHAQIKSLLSQVPADRYRLVPFEREIGAMYKLFDLYVHVPIDPHIEAFGQTYVEALAAGVPSVFTMSGIAHDFIVNDRNAVVVTHKNVDQIVEALVQLINDQEKRKRLSMQGRKDVFDLFQLAHMIDRLKEVYRKI